MADTLIQQSALARKWNTSGKTIRNRTIRDGLPRPITGPSRSVWYRIDDVREVERVVKQSVFTSRLRRENQELRASLDRIKSLINSSEV